MLEAGHDVAAVSKASPLLLLLLLLLLLSLSLSLSVVCCFVVVVGGGGVVVVDCWGEVLTPCDVGLHIHLKCQQFSQC